MARIPLLTGTQGLEIPGAVQYPSGSPVGGAMQQAGGALQQAGNQFRRQNEQLDEERKLQDNLVDAAEADAFLAEKSREMVRQFEADPNYETFAERSAKASKELVQQASGMFRDPKQREVAGFNAQRHLAAVQDQILGIGEVRRKSTAAVTLDNSLETFRQIYADPSASRGERLSSREAIEAGIQRGVETGLYTPDQAEAPPEVFIRGADYVYGQRLIEADPSILGGISQASSSVVERIIGVESVGNPTAKNPNSSATGLGQFTSGTWMQIVRKYKPQIAQCRTIAEVLALRNNADVSRRMTAHLVQENSEALRRAGAPVTDGSVYLAHFAGSGGAVALLKADPNASAESVLGAAVVEANPFLRGKTAADVIAWADRKMGGASSAPAVSDRPKWFQDLNPEQQLALERQADTRPREIAAERNRQNTEYLAGVTDYTAYLRAGNPLEPGSPYSAESLYANLGPERGAEVYREVLAAESYGADVAAVRFADPNKLRAIVAARQEFLQSPEDYQAHRQDVAGLFNVIEARNKALLDDPATYVVQQPQVQQAYLQIAEASGTAGEDDELDAKFIKSIQRPVWSADLFPRRPSAATRWFARWPATSRLRPRSP
jgi:hypothetical protein